jgi:uncharacterized protein (DUF2062 family)
MAVSVFVGTYIGCQPLYGLHLVLCLLLCLPLRLDAVVAYLAANISNPLLAPFLLFAEAEAGAWLVLGRQPSFDLSLVQATKAAGLAWNLVVGAQLVGVVLGTSLGALAYAIAVGLKRASVVQAPVASALRRTIRRYDACKLADRMYVAMKLELDPLTRQLCSLAFPLGRVLDVGCGRGQFSLFLRELELTEAVSGFDWDPRKVAVAQAAAASDAQFAVIDASNAELPRADTLLLFDVLHYLDLPAQRALLERLSASLAEGGRLLVREMDGQAGWASRIGQCFERLATLSGYNRARQLCFQPISALLTQLDGLGFECSICDRGGSRWSGPNVLLVARRTGVTREQAP